MKQPLYVAFVWHMHQPYYKEYASGEYMLPWARLHGAKDYLHMAELLVQHPRIKAVFNFVPSLLEQLQEYSSGKAQDIALKLSRQQSWTNEEKKYLLSFFFSVNWDRIIRQFPRYSQLLDIYHSVRGQAQLLDEAYYRDLIAWFNLAWISPNWLRRDPDLRRLVEKGESFSFDDINIILEKQRQIIEKTLPLYNRLQYQKQVEITFSPYYHPIIPLLIDGANAQRPSPGLNLPQQIFKHPEDAAEQVRRGIQAYRKSFGAAPSGMWPSEGAICQEMLPVLARQRVRWFASDEEILARSLGISFQRDPYGHLTNPEALYQPYLLPTAEGSVYAIFRDHVISDRIGFVYQHMEGDDAAQDLINRLQVAHERLPERKEPYLLSIILDGENCWESYPGYGEPFLEALYTRLSKEKDILTTTVTEYITQYPPQRELSSLATGSWIGGNLETWIGEAEQNRAWEYLNRVRNDLVSWQNAVLGADIDILDEAWRQIYIAEGSDWFWWYYSRNVSGQDHLFDRAFRDHLAGVYYIIGWPVPSWLTEPIQNLTARQDYRAIGGIINPHIIADEIASLEWTGAGFLEPALSTGSMQRAGTSILHRLYFGYNPSTLFFRLESGEALGPYNLDIYLRIDHARPEQVALPGMEGAFTRGPYGSNARIEHISSGKDALHVLDQSGQWITSSVEINSAASERVWEIAIPAKELGLAWGESVGFTAALSRDGVLLESIPTQDLHTFQFKELS